MTSKLTRQERVQALYDLKIGQTLSHDDIANIKMLARLALSMQDSEPVAWRYRYTKSGVTDSCGEPWVGDWRYVDDYGSCNQDENYERQALYTSPQPAPVDISKITEAAEDILLMLDEYPEQLVPVNRGS